MVDVGVQVDEPREHEAAAGVNVFAPEAEVECRGDSGDAIAADGNVKPAVTPRKGVDEVTTVNDDVVLHVVRPRCRR